MSKKFNNLLYENLKKTALKRVRIKCDPRLSSVLDFSHVDQYEGYILEECSETVSVMVIKQGMPIISVPTDTTTPVEEPTVSSNKLSGFKQYISKLFKSGDPLFSQIKDKGTIEEIEAILSQNNVTPEKFLHILRKFLNGEVLIEQIEAPSFMSNVGQFAKNAVTGTANALMNAGETAQKINQLTGQLKQGNYGQIAKGISEAWDKAKEENYKKLLKQFEWPTGYPKKGENIKIINPENTSLNNKQLNITGVTKTGKNTIYTGSVLGLAGPLGMVGATFVNEQDTVNDHNVSVKFTEGSSVSEKYTENTRTGDTYILSYSSTKRQFELAEGNSKLKELTVEVKKDTKIGEVGEFRVIARIGTIAGGHIYRVKIISSPFQRLKDGAIVYVAHAVQV